MARTVVSLTDPKCDAAKYNPDGKNNKLADGGGLFLLLKPTGSKSWRMKYTRPADKKEDMLVIGDYPAVKLKQARQQREKARALLAEGIDPKMQRREDEVLKQQAMGNTFEAVAREWHHIKAAKLSPDYASRMLKRMEDNLFPEIGRRPVNELKTRDLMLPLKKIEQREAPVIAERMKQAITGVMRHAVQNGLIDSNPALDLVGSIAPRETVHRPALPLARLPELQQRIDAYSGTRLTRLATQLMLLTFVRSSELRFARWPEIDFKHSLWTIPSKREALEGVKFSTRGAKMRSPHLVPLSLQAVAVLERIKELSGQSHLVFPGESSSGSPISEGTINQALQRMGYDSKADVCGHGFRTMACGALVQSGLWQEDAVERQMSHQERNSVRLAYTHAAEFIQERRLMMQWWADFLDANRKHAVSPYDYDCPTENIVKL
ncbi:MAG: integrase arm-type DNA-binding domain-containing protein [Pseudomonadota bacterium]